MKEHMPESRLTTDFPFQIIDRAGNIVIKWGRSDKYCWWDYNYSVKKGLDAKKRGVNNMPING